MYVVAIFGLAIVVGLALSKTGASVWQRTRVAGFARPTAVKLEEFFNYKGLLFLALELKPHEEQIRKSATDLLDAYHHAAIVAQDRYHEAISTAVSATAVGFLALSVTLTVGEGIPLLVQFCAALDVTCFGLALLSFHTAIRANGLWIKARIRNELLRQWCVVDNLLVPPPASPDVTTRFESFAKRVETIFAVSHGRTLTRAKHRDVIDNVMVFWRARRDELQRRLLAEPITIERLATHFRKRPMTQVQWFKQSYDRLLSQSEWRSGAVLWMYIATVILAVAKLVLAFHWAPEAWLGAKPYLALLILALVGASSGLAALYLNQNTRSLVHRYDAQERRILDWLQDYRVLLLDIQTTPASAVSQELTVRVIAAVILFEAIMIDELLDWIAISQSDIMELSAS